MYGDVTQITAKNESIEAANGVRYAYRRYGNAGTSALPLVFFQHFAATWTTGTRSWSTPSPSSAR